VRLPHRNSRSEDDVKTHLRSEAIPDDFNGHRCARDIDPETRKIDYVFIMILIL